MPLHHHEIGRMRLHQQAVLPTRFDTPAEIVRWMGAMQAQDYHQAVWAIGARLHQPMLSAVEAAIEQGAIVRTWPMRGTIHFVPAADARWMVRLTATRIIERDARRQNQLELDSAILSRCERLVTDALVGGQRLTRSALLQALDDAGISTANQRGYHILWFLAQLGLIAIGPMAGKEQTFVLLDEWAPQARDLTGGDALAELTRRYFVSHGPATVHDFAWWAGLTLKEARAGLDSIAAEVEHERIAGVSYWWSRDAAALPLDDGQIALLPGFDEFFLGYQDRGAVIDPADLQQVCPGGNGVFKPMIVAGGRIVGTWKRTLKKTHVQIVPEPFTALDAEAHEALVAAAGRYAGFHDLGLAVK